MLEKIQRRHNLFTRVIFVSIFNYIFVYGCSEVFINYVFRYLNNQHIRKNKLSEAELIYGNHPNEDVEPMEIGELGW